MHIRRLLVGLGALAAIYGMGFQAAHAAPPPNISQSVGVCDPWFPTRCTQAGPFVPDSSSTASLAVTASSARVALPGTGLTVVATNNGTTDIYVKLGSSTVTAATTDFFLGAGHSVALARGSSTYIAARTASGTSTLLAQTGSGTPSISGGGGGGSSGGGTTVTATAVAPTYVEGSSTNPVSSDLHGSLRSTILDASGTAVDWSASVAVTQGGTFTVQPGNTANTTAWKVDGSAVTQPVSNAGTFAVQEQASTSGGTSSYHVIPGASDNHVVIKNGAGQVYSLDVTSIHSTYQYMRLYDAGTGFNGCNSATNIIGGWIIPGAATGAGAIKVFPVGRAFTNGLSICYTGAFTDTDTTNATASVSSVNVGYK